MPIYKGADKIAAIYKGSTAIARVYAGDVRVFDADGGGPPPAGAHRYWRVLFTEANDDGTQVSVARMEMYEAALGQNVCTGGTPYSGHNDSGWPASEAFDDDLEPSNAWASTGSGGALNANAWLGYDFGSGNEKEIVEIGMYLRCNITDQRPIDFTIEYSDDNDDWYEAWSVTGADWTGKNWKRFTSPSADDPTYTDDGSPWGAHAYWRVHIATNSYSATSAAEIVFKAQPGGAAVSVGGTSAAQNQFGGNHSGLAFDGNSGTLYAGNTTYTWIRYNFPGAVEVAQVDYQARSDSGFANQSIYDGTIEFADDDDGPWTVAWEVYHQSWSELQVKQFVDPNYIGDVIAPPTTGRYWRATNWTAWADSNVTPGSLLFYDGDGTDPPLDYTPSSDGDYGGRPVSGMNDATGLTYWTPTGPLRKMQADFGFDLTTPIYKVDVYTNEGIGSSWHYWQGPKTFNLDFSVDGIEWFRYATNVTVPTAWSVPGQMQTIVIVPD